MLFFGEESGMEILDNYLENTQRLVYFRTALFDGHSQIGFLSALNCTAYNRQQNEQ